MRTEKVEVLPYREEWQTEFEKIKDEIRCALGDLAIDVVHVGSTAVRCLAAKPCIEYFTLIRQRLSRGKTCDSLIFLYVRNINDLW